jgi:hypothetical protein
MSYTLDDGKWITYEAFNDPPHPSMSAFEFYGGYSHTGYVGFGAYGLTCIMVVVVILASMARRRLT